MSGGYFIYSQNRIKDIIDILEDELKQQGEDIPIADRCCYDTKNDDPDYYKYPIYSEEVQEAMIEGLKIIDKAYVYAQRIDWFLSDDDGEKSFLERLEKDLKKLAKKDYEKFRK